MDDEMRNAALLAGLAILALGAPARADLSFTWSRLSLEFGNLGRAEASVTATGLSTFHTSSATSSHLQTATLTGLALETTVPVTDPLAAPITAAVFSLRQRPDLQGGGVLGNFSGAIASTAGGLVPNTLPMTGGVAFCILSQFTCLPQLNLPFGATSAAAQVGGGVGGILTVGGVGTVRISLIGAPYTVKTVSVVSRTGGGGFSVATEQGFAHGPLSLTSSTAQPSGVFQVVSASRTITVSPGVSDFGGNISRLLVHFIVPEPGLPLLGAAGALALGLLARRRRRRLGGGAGR